MVFPITVGRSWSSVEHCRSSLASPSSSSVLRVITLPRTTCSNWGWKEWSTALFEITTVPGARPTDNATETFYIYSWFHNQSREPSLRAPFMQACFDPKGKTVVYHLKIEESLPTPPDVPMRKRTTSRQWAWCSSLISSCSMMEMEGTPIPCYKGTNKIGFQLNIQADSLLHQYFHMVSIKK